MFNWLYWRQLINYFFNCINQHNGQKQQIAKLQLIKWVNDFMSSEGII